MADQRQVGDAFGGEPVTETQQQIEPGQEREFRPEGAENEKTLLPDDRKGTGKQTGIGQGRTPGWFKKRIEP